MKEEDKEKLIFELFKDKPLSSSRKFKCEVYKRYKINTTRDLYTRLVNYQIKKYGRMLESGYGVGDLSKEEFEKKKQHFYKQKYRTKNREWLEESRRIRERK